MSSHSNDFIDYLVNASKRENGKAFLADLKHGLSGVPAEDVKMFPHVIKWTSKLHKNQENIYFLVAALFGYYPEHTDKEVDIGKAYRKIQIETGSDSIEKRFLNLLESDVEDLQASLFSFVSLAKSKNILINWKLLIHDILYWDHDENFIQKKLAKSFWN